MLLSLVVVPANAALVSGTGTLTITPNVTSVPGSDSAPAEVIYTIKVTPPTEGPVGEFHFNLKAPDGMTLADAEGEQGKEGYWVNPTLSYHKTYNKEGIFETFEYTPASKYFQAYGTSASRNMTAEAEIMTIKATIAAGKVGDFTLTAENVGINKDGTDSYSVDVKTTPVTITKAPIDSVTASVKKPEAGKALDTSVDIGTASGYTGAVEWYEGDSATGTVATGNAKPNTKYTAKITLTASSGESFADSVTIPADYTKDSSTNNKLVLTRTFDATGSLPAASVTDAPTAKSGLKYDGTKKDLLGFKGNADGGTMQYRLGDSGAFTTDIPMATDAGTYTVYYMVKGDSTHSDYTPSDNTVSVKIEPKDISSATIGTIANQSYTGGAITPDPEVKDGTTPLTKDKDYTVSCTDTYVGTAELTITGKGNYTGTNTAKFTIVAADQKPTFTPPKDLATGGQLDLRTLVDGAKGDVTFNIPPATTSANLSGYMLTATGIKGEVKVSVSITAKDVNNDGKNEYNAFHKDNAITVNVVDKTPDSSTMTVTQSDIIYGGSVSPTVTNKPDGTGTVSYTYEGRNGTSYSSSATAPKNVGEYTVKAKCESSTTIYTAEANFAIQPKSISGMTVTLSDTSLEYNGSAQTVTVTSVGSLTDADYTVTGETSGTNVRSYTVTVTGKGNYTNTAKATWEITAKDVTVTGITATNRAYAKDNLEVALTGGTLSGVLTGDTVTIDLTNAKGTMTDANAGNGKAVTVTGVTLGGADKGNYKLKAQPTGVTVNITKETAPTLTNITVSQKYNVTTEQSKDIDTTGMPADAGALTYAKGTESKTGSVTIDSWDVDATGKVTYKLSNGAVDDTVTLPVVIKSTNYADATVNVVITLIKGSSGGYYYAPTAAVVPDMPMLYRGCTGDAVKTLQDKLNALGYNSGSVDGIFGAKTYAAVTAFQKANSLGVDGIVGKLTWGKLYGVSPAMPVETTTVVGRPMVSYGSRGDAVRKLQELLNALGYDCGSVDGIFGSKTKAAVLAFQKANGLGVDGIVGPLTWAKLG